MNIDLIAKEMRRRISLNCACEQAADDSLPGSTYCVVDGQRVGIAFDLPKVIQWCLLTGPVDKEAFLILADDNLVQWLTPEPYFYTQAGVFASRGAASNAIAEARSRFETQKRRPLHRDEDEIFSQLTVVPILAADEEIQAGQLPIEVARQRLTAAAISGVDSSSTGEF